MSIPNVVPITDLCETPTLTNELQEVAQKIANHAVKIIDRAQNLWAGDGGPNSMTGTTTSNLIALARNRFEHWMETIQYAKTITKEESKELYKQPRTFDGYEKNYLALNQEIRSASVNPIPYLSERVYRVIKAHVSRYLSKPGKGGISLASIPTARLIVTLAMQKILNYYSVGEGILHTDFGTGTSSPS